MSSKCIIIVALFAFVHTAKILVVIPTPSISHQVVFLPLIQELLNRGHEVTYITTDPIYPQNKLPNNLTEINLHDVSYSLWNKMLSSLQNNQKDMLSTMTTVLRVGIKVLEKQLKDKSVQKLIKDKRIKFDLLLIEARIAPTLIFAHVFKAPVIQISSLGPHPGFMNTIGAVTHPLIYPTHYHQRIYNLTIWEKISELYSHLAINQMFVKQEIDDVRMLQRLFGTDTPRLNELKNNIHLLFLNVHPSWLHNPPVPPNVVYTWGILKTPENKLPKDLQSYLDSSTNGVIYISFGTNFKTSSIPSNKLQILIKVLSRSPLNILWKWDSDELPGKSKNIKTSKWFPQNDVLRHPNLKLFITQGGLQSTEEAINAGVPLIGIPIHFDQEYNTEKYVHFKIGIQIKFETLTIEMFEEAIQNISIDYDSYRKNIINLRTQMQDQRKPSLENAIWWIDYVLRHGGARQLRSPAANISWTAYYEIELIFVIICGLIVILSLLLLLRHLCFKFVSRIMNSEN